MNGFHSLHNVVHPLECLHGTHTDRMMHKQLLFTHKYFSYLLTLQVPLTTQHIHKKQDDVFAHITVWEDLLLHKQVLTISIIHMIFGVAHFAQSVQEDMLK